MRVRTHYLPMIQPDTYEPKIIGYNVWAWIGHPLLGQIKGTKVFVKTKYQAQKTAQQMKQNFNEE